MRTIVVQSGRKEKKIEPYNTLNHQFQLYFHPLAYYLRDLFGPTS